VGVATNNSFEFIVKMPSGKVLSLKLLEWGELMRSWRSRLVLSLIIYFAGFATAIYTLAPEPENKARQSQEKSFAFPALKSDEFAQSFNQGIHKCVDFGKDAASRAGKFIKQRLNEKENLNN
jgi:hypothetical protein